MSVIVRTMFQINIIYACNCLYQSANNIKMLSKIYNTLVPVLLFFAPLYVYNYIINAFSISIFSEWIYAKNNNLKIVSLLPWIAGSRLTSARFSTILICFRCSTVNERSICRFLVTNSNIKIKHLYNIVKSTVFLWAFLLLK